MKPHTNSAYVDGLAAPVDALYAEVDSLETIELFASAMARHGYDVLPLRMLWDAIYAHEQIALAHTTADSELRRQAVQMFQRYTQLNAIRSPRRARQPTP